jgi:hypothetical protein
MIILHRVKVARDVVALHTVGESQLRLILAEWIPRHHSALKEIALQLQVTLFPASFVPFAAGLDGYILSGPLPAFGSACGNPRLIRTIFEFEQE